MSSGDIGVKETDVTSEDQTVADKMITRLPKKGATTVSGGDFGMKGDFDTV